MEIYHVKIFGIHLTLNPVAFTLPIGSGWSIYWYGILIATGFLLALIYAMKTAKRFNLNTDHMLDVVLVTTPLAILGARAYYIIFDPASSFKNFFDFSGAGFSGLAIYGGVIVTFAVGFAMCLLTKVKITDMFDIAAVGFLIGQCCGRWGNFVNQEAFGSPTGSKWFGMTSENVETRLLELNQQGKSYHVTDLVHPCFLYESLWCLAGFFLLNHFSKKRKFSGQIILMYGVWYGFGRGFIELLRTDSLMIGAFRVSSLLSFILCITCSILLYVFLNRSKQIDKEGDYIAMFEEEAALAEDVENTTEIEKETATETDEDQKENTDEQTD